MNIYEYIYIYIYIAKDTYIVIHISYIPMSIYRDPYIYIYIISIYIHIYIHTYITYIYFQRYKKDSIMYQVDLLCLILDFILKICQLFLNIILTDCAKN